MSNVQPDRYQSGVIDFVVNGRGDGMVNAVAGSGKTTTLLLAAEEVRGPAIFCAFNKHIAEVLAQRLAGTTMAAKTIHGIGYGVLAQQLGRVQVEDRKYAPMCADYVEEATADWETGVWEQMRRLERARSQTNSESERARIQDELDRLQGEYADMPTRAECVNALRDAVNKCRATLTNPKDSDALRELLDKYGIDLPPGLHDGVAEVLRLGERDARTQRVIDYTDMLWLPWRWRLSPRPAAHIFVDECQDLNAAQLDLVLKLRAPGGRYLFMGDPRQAIFGFAGADAESYKNILVRTEATELPLSICYRCPSSHIELARAIVPHIEARPGAAAGTVAQVAEDALPALVREGDLILCRLTAPLIRLCIQLIVARIPARVRGRDIGKQLVGMVEQITKLSGFDWQTFPMWLAQYRSIQMDKMAQTQASDERIQSLNDRCDGLQAVYDGTHAANVSAFCADIQSLFADERASIWLSTVHRAKGLEAERVYIVQPDKLPLVWPRQQAWEAEQEQNLKYVALTRAKDTLTFVHEKVPEETKK